MDRFIGQLLSELHSAFTVAVCPGDWPWTVTVAGGVVALLPMLGAMLAAATRRFTGNRYGPGPLLGFALIGLTMTALLPWIAFRGSSQVFRGALLGDAADVGLTRNDLVSLGEQYCFGTTQGDYLGGARSVRDVLGQVSGDGIGVFVGAVGLLVVLPLFCWLFVLAQSRLAFRRGPKWPARLLWLPMLALVLATAPQSATVVAHLWLGFLPVAVVGLLGVLLVGAPRWDVVNRSSAAPPPPPAIAQRPAPAQLPRGGPPAAPPRPAPTPVQRPVEQPRRTPTAPFGVPEPAPPAPAQPAPVSSVPPSSGAPPKVQSPPAAQSGRPADRKLAADPGPLPDTLLRAMAAAVAANTGAAASEPPEPPTLPASRFRRIRPLGSGGFGTVWLAMDTALDRTVAVKAAKVPDAETERRIRREARALAAVHHPNCVRIYDILTDTDGELALIMEFVPGRSLSAEIDEAGRLTDGAAARMWSTLAAALHAAHGQGVLHRDVKPSNIIIDEAGYPHLIDFGIARATGDITLTAAGMVLGTPDYMAPEVAAGKPASPAADAWQLAATVSFALAGVPPRGHRDGAVAAMLAAAQGEPCNQLPEDSALLDLLERALHPDPARRPNLPTVQTELARWLSGTGQQVDGPVTQGFTPLGPGTAPGSRPPSGAPGSRGPGPGTGASPGPSGPGPSGPGPSGPGSSGPGPSGPGPSGPGPSGVGALSGAGMGPSGLGGGPGPVASGAGGFGGQFGSSGPSGRPNGPGGPPGRPGPGSGAGPHGPHGPGGQPGGPPGRQGPGGPGGYQDGMPVRGRQPSGPRPTLFDPNPPGAASPFGPADSPQTPGRPGAPANGPTDSPPGAPRGPQPGNLRPGQQPASGRPGQQQGGRPDGRQLDGPQGGQQRRPGGQAPFGQQPGRSLFSGDDQRSAPGVQEPTRAGPPPTRIADFDPAAVGTPSTRVDPDATHVGLPPARAGDPDATHAAMPPVRAPRPPGATPPARTDRGPRRSSADDATDPGPVRSAPSRGDDPAATQAAPPPAHDPDSTQTALPRVAGPRTVRPTSGSRGDDLDATQAAPPPGQDPDSTQAALAPRPEARRERLSKPGREPQSPATQAMAAPDFTAPVAGSAGPAAPAAPPATAEPGPAATATTQPVEPGAEPTRDPSSGSAATSKTVPGNGTTAEPAGGPDEKARPGKGTAPDRPAAQSPTAEPAAADATNPADGTADAADAGKPAGATVPAGSTAASDPQDTPAKAMTVPAQPAWPTEEQP